MGGQGIRHQLHVAIRAAGPLAEPLLIGVPLHRHLEAVGVHIVTPKCAEMLTDHAHCLGHIGADYNMIE